MTFRTLGKIPSSRLSLTVLGKSCVKETDGGSKMLLSQPLSLSLSVLPFHFRSHRKWKEEEEEEQSSGNERNSLLEGERRRRRLFFSHWL